MNITFLIGNGFDLNLELKTKYSDFLYFYRQTKENEQQYLINFKKMITENLDLWSNAELAFGDYTNQFDNTEEGVTDFCNCYEDFCNQLAEYLDCEENKLLINFHDLNISEIFAPCISSFCASFRQAQKQKIMDSLKVVGAQKIYSFINFNYTKTLDNFVKSLDETVLLGNVNINGTIQNNKVGQVLHVHGTTATDMVLGLDNEEQIKNLKLFENQAVELKNSIIKQRVNNMNERFNDENVCRLLEESNLIYIYGMSIGKTDTLWWQRIGKLMISNKKLRVIIHKFNAPIDSERLRTKYRLFEKKSRNELLDYFDLSEDAKEGLKERIHIDSTNIFSKLNERILELEEINEGELVKELVTV